MARLQKCPRQESNLRAFRRGRSRLLYYHLRSAPGRSRTCGPFAEDGVGCSFLRSAPGRSRTCGPFAEDGVGCSFLRSAPGRSRTCGPFAEDGVGCSFLRSAPGRSRTCGPFAEDGVGCSFLRSAPGRSRTCGPFAEDGVGCSFLRSAPGRSRTCEPFAEDGVGCSFLRSAPGRSRTCDLSLRRRLLYPLSYWGATADHPVTRARGCGSPTRTAAICATAAAQETIWHLRLGSRGVAGDAPDRSTRREHPGDACPRTLNTSRLRPVRRRRPRTIRGRRSPPRQAPGDGRRRRHTVGEGGAWPACSPWAWRPGSAWSTSTATSTTTSTWSDLSTSQLKNRPGQEAGRHRPQGAAQHPGDGFRHPRRRGQQHRQPHRRRRAVRHHDHVPPLGRPGDRLRHQHPARHPRRPTRLLRQERRRDPGRDRRDVERGVLGRRPGVHDAAVRAARPASGSTTTSCSTSPGSRTWSTRSTASRSASPRTSTTPRTGSTSRAGTREIEGKEALNYVRARYTLGDGSDIGRIKRQQAFIAAMASKVIARGTLARVDRLVGFLDAATSSLQTDIESILQDRQGRGRLQEHRPRQHQVRHRAVPVLHRPAGPGRVPPRGRAAVAAGDRRRTAHPPAPGRRDHRRRRRRRLVAGHRLPSSPGGTESPSDPESPSAEEREAAGLCA